MVQFDMLLQQVSGFTPGRTAAILPAILGLISVIIGALILARSSSRPKYGQLIAVAVLVIGAVALVQAGMHLSRSISQSLGTGSGRLGATVALVLGLIGVVLGVLTLYRLQKTHPGK